MTVRFTCILQLKPILVGDWHYIEATAKFVCGDEVEVVTAYAREPLNKKGMDESQITGTASSYARKVVLYNRRLIDFNQSSIDISLILLIIE